MKKTLLLIGALIFFSCSIDDDEMINAIQSQEQNATQEFGDCETVNAGEDAIISITYSEAAAIESWDEVRKLYLSLLDAGVPRNGSFDPSIWDLINAFNEAEDPIGDYTTTYTITDGDCTDSVTLTVSVVPNFSEPVCDAVNAGEDNSISLTYSEAAAIESWDEVRKLYLSLLDAGVLRNGSFDPSIWDLINAFNEAEDPTGDYTTTYTITDGDCTDSVTLTVSVVPDFSEPVCDSVNAGEDNSISMAYSEAAAIESWDEVRKLYLSLLDAGVPRNGSFDPSIWDLINAFNEAEDPIGNYTTTYTITEGDCTDTVELTVTVIQDPIN